MVWMEYISVTYCACYLFIVGDSDTPSYGDEVMSPKNGPMAIDSRRHPILENIHNDFVANNIFLSEASNMAIVTGPNM
ncbi:hypothetical protein AHAS_Ahas08G0077200 [Arachis hypogaea]